MKSEPAIRPRTDANGVIISPFLSAVIQDGPNKGKTIAECITANMVRS